MFEGVAKELR